MYVPVRVRLTFGGHLPTGATIVLPSSNLVVIVLFLLTYDRLRT